MTSVEKRRSGRKSSGHRKHSDGGFSDTSSGGSFLDETDREVSNLTDRAFRSLCIGDEAVYNDSDLCSSSPCTQRDRQLAFSQRGQDRNSEEAEREELKRAAHESFSLRMQQYGQDLIHGGMYGAEVQRDPQWEVYGEKTQGRVSATFQDSFMEMSQQEQSLKEEQLSFFSNGATELSLQQRRSRSRVSSLIRAFNSEGQRDGVGFDGQLKEWNDETSWDKSALMSIQKELSEFSSYQQNFNSGHFAPAGQFPSQDTHVYSPEVAAVAHMNAAPSFMRSSHSKHSMLTHVNCNSNFFIHSEFSPFKVWRDHNRFPFQQGEVSGFMHHSEFPKWCETPMYKELSLEAQPQGPYMFEERGFRNQRNNMATMVPANPPRSTSTSTVLQKASALEKRCESELAGHYPHRMRTQSLGTNRLPSQRPLTASPTIEMSRRVRDTISSVKALQQKIKMMTEQNTATEMTANKRRELCGNENLIPFGYSTIPVAPNPVSSIIGTTPLNTGQMLASHVPHVHQEVHTSVSPQLVEHPPVRAESRGGTPDVRMSSYKSRATSLLFNLKDNRKRVKSTYSPPKFKVFETPDKSKQPYSQEPRDTVIDIPEFLDADIGIPHVEESSWTDATLQQYGKQYYSPGQSFTGHNLEYTSSEYRTAQMEGEMFHHSGNTGFIPEHYTSNHLANGQNLHEDLSSFTPYKQGMIENAEAVGEDAYMHKPSFPATEIPRLNAENSHREYLTSKDNNMRYINETVGRESTKVDRYQQPEENKHDYGNVSTQDQWRQKNIRDTEKFSEIAAIAPWKQEISGLMEKDPHDYKNYQRAAAIKEEHSSPGDKYRGENRQKLNEKFEKMTQPAPPNEAVQNSVYYQQQQAGAFRDEHMSQKYPRQSVENEIKGNYLTPNHNRYADQEYRNKHSFQANEVKTTLKQETNKSRKQHSPMLKQHEIQSLQAKDTERQSEHNIQTNSLSVPDKTYSAPTVKQVKDRQIVEVKAGQDVADQIIAQQTQAELANAQQWSQAEQPRAESAKFILGGQNGSEKVRAQRAEQEGVKPAKAEFVADKAKTEYNEAEHQTEKPRREKRTEQSGRKQPEPTREGERKAEQAGGQHAIDEPRNVTEEKQAEQMTEEQSKVVEAEPAYTERLKDEHIKTAPRIEQVKTQQSQKETIITVEAEAQLVKAELAERQRTKAEQIGTGKVQVEQATAEQRQAQQAKLQQMTVQQTKTGQEKAKVVGVGNGMTERNVEGVREKKDEEYLIPSAQENAKKSVAEIRKPEEAKADVRKIEKAKVEQTTELAKIELAKTELVKSEPAKAELAQMELAKRELAKTELAKMELVKIELAKTESKLAKTAKPTVKLAMSQQGKCQQSKVELVKTELAKAKAELAKIKDKMREEQKEKVRKAVCHQEDDISKKDVALGVNINQGEVNKEQVTQVHQQKEDLLDSRYNRDQCDRGADDYESLRGKYGFTTPISTPRKKASPATDISLKDVRVTSEEINNMESKDKCNTTLRFATSKTENTEEKDRMKSNEMTESQYIYSAASKEFKLPSADYSPVTVDKSTSNYTVSDKVKEVTVEMLKKRDPQKSEDVSKPRDLDFYKPRERKSKPSEHSVVSGKDQHFPPPRALSHKERAQTKQEILTSKIKAHAEKEISAIREKGFALRDGIISKNPNSKQFSGSQSANVRQRPQSQEVSRRHEGIMSSSATPKHQTGPSGMEAVKSVSLSSSAATTSQTLVHSKEQVPKEPMVSDDTEPDPPPEAKQRSYSTSTDGSLIDSQKKENQPVIKSPTQYKEQEPDNSKGTQETKQGENNKKLKEGFVDKTAIDTEQPYKKNEDPSQATIHEDSSPSLKLIIGQDETSVADDSLQIRGIMVTVHERINNGQIDKSIQEQTHAKETEDSNTEPDKYDPRSAVEVCKENESLVDISTDTAMGSIVQETQPRGKKDLPSVSLNNHCENVQNSPTTETRKTTVNDNIIEKQATSQQGCSYTHARPQREIQPQELLAGKEVTSTVTVTSKNNVLADTQPLLCEQDIIAKEMKDKANKKAQKDSATSLTKDQEGINTEKNNPHVSEKFTDKVVDAAITEKQDSNKGVAETHPTLKEDITTAINPPRSKNIDGKRAPLLEENIHESTPSTKSSVPISKTSASDRMIKNENGHESEKQQYKETRLGENNQPDNDVHIDSIAIRVVPSVAEKDNLEIFGKHSFTSVHSDVAVVDEHKQVALTSPVGKVSTLSKDDKEPTPASHKKQIENNCEDKLEEQSLLHSEKRMAASLKTSEPQNGVNESRLEHTLAENGMPEKVQKNELTSKIQPMEGDYFQVQGVKETSNVPNNNNADAGEMSDVVSEGRELPELPPSKVEISNESYKEEKQVFALDQRKRETVESRSVSAQDENMKRHSREMAVKSALKQTDCPTETHSSNFEKMEAGQAIHIRRNHHTENRSSLSARERQSSKTTQPTRAIADKEEPEVKSKTKERVPTIPEISALADYARLKVIVSDDREDTVRELPPNKKEGFFPLIQSRHSRRPVFTADPQDLSVKAKSFPNKKDISPTVNKEPKPIVFPITDEHQRTGMFKLGEKERQEKVLRNGKGNGGVLETVEKHPQGLAERKGSSKTHIKNQESREVPGTCTQRVSQVGQSVHQPSHRPIQATTASSSVIKPGNTSESQHLKPLVTLNPDENPGELSSPERMSYLDKDTNAQTLLGTVHSMKDSKTHVRKHEGVENKNRVVGSGEQRSEKSILHEETVKKPQRRSKRLEEDLASRREEEKRIEDTRIKHATEQSKASLTEEERRAAQRKEERRAKEREAIAAEIRGRREKQKETEQRAEVERKAKQVEDTMAALKELERRESQTEDERRVKEIQERRTKTEEVRREERRAEEEMMKETEGRRQREEERAAEEEQLRRAARIEERRRAREIEEKRLAQNAEERRIKHLQEQKEQQQQTREQGKERQKKEERMRSQGEERERNVVEKDEATAGEKEQQQAKEQRTRLLEEVQAQREETFGAEKNEEEILAAPREEERASQMEEQKRASQRMDALQYYAITSTESERKPRERQPHSPLPFQQRNRTSESSEGSRSHGRPHRPYAPSSPSPSLPRSNTSSPALGGKPLMFKVKDNTIRGSGFTKSVKPRFHKSFREDYRAGSPMERGSERGEEGQETVRRDAGTPVHPDTATGTSRLAAIKESLTFQPTSSSQDYSAPLRHYRPYSRRSIALDEDDSRSVISNMSEDVESFATSAADLADVRGLYDFERPESACSFSSDVSRSMGKPPAVPPKSEKALRRAKRLTTRRIKKELSKDAADRSAEKSLLEASSTPSSSSNEVCSSNRHAVATPHFSSPVSLIHAPASGSSLPSSPTDSKLSCRYALPDATPVSPQGASPHATAPLPLPAASPCATPVSLPVISPHATAPVSLQVTAPHATAPVSLPVTSPHATAPVSLQVTAPYATAPVSLPVTSPHATAPVSLQVTAPHATAPVSLPVTSPNATAPVALQVTAPHATAPVSLPVTSPNATAPVSLQVTAPHATVPVSLPVTSPHATVPVSFPVTSPHATVPVSLPVTSPHATVPVSLPVTYPHATAPVSLPVTSPYATVPVSLQVTTPHATAPVSLPVTTTHATTPVSLPVASPHATEPPGLSVSRATTAPPSVLPPHASAPVSLPVASPHTTPVSPPAASPHSSVHAPHPLSHLVASKTVPHVPSSPNLYHTNHPAPVTQYQLESSYPQSYPLTQRKVLQDIGTGQYYVVDAPVQVKTKTFFDPETGKYVQLNVRESGQNIYQPQSQQVYPQPRPQPHLQVKQQQQFLSQASPAGKPFVLYQGYHSYPQGCQTAGISTVHPQRPSSGLSGPVTLPQESVRDSHIYRHQTHEHGPNSEGYCCSPEQTPYMDTVNASEKTRNAVYNRHGSCESFPDCETNSQLAGNTVNENDSAAHSRCQPRNIITMGELDDFMEVSDW